jgi:hypothetical protein
MASLLSSLFVSLFVWSGESLANDVNDQVTVRISQGRGGFEIQASYFAPLNQCQAYVLLTDFSASEPSEGIKASKIKRLSENTVRVEQRVEDKILFFSTNFDSIIDYTEYPMTGMDLKQIQGYFKEYFGSWRLLPDAGGTIFTYKAFLLPDSAIPMFVIEHFMNSRIQTRFTKMAQRAKGKAGLVPDQCK